MAVLLVDDRSGRVINLFADWRTATEALETLEKRVPKFAERLSLVRFRDQDHSLIATSSSITVRSLT